MVQFVGLATLSDLIHDCSSHCLPGWPYHGLGTDWPLGGFYLVDLVGRLMFSIGVYSY